MLVKLTFVKRFLKDNFLYRKGRIYNVDESMGLRLCGLMNKDMPMFQIVAPEAVADSPVVNLQIEDEEEDIPVVQVNVVEKTADPRKRKTVTEKAKPKAKAKSKAKAPRIKKPTAKAEHPSNVVQV